MGTSNGMGRVGPIRQRRSVEMAAIKEKRRLRRPPVHGAPEPAWDVALFYPFQGQWTEDDYLSLPADGRRVEMTEGVIEVLPMPTEAHQSMVLFLVEALSAFVRARALGKVLLAGLSVRLRPGTFREPDVLFMCAENAGRRHNQFWEGADLAMEVVSGDRKDRKRDLETKRREYAQAGIPEYWIVDPKEERILVLVLDGEEYREHGDFRRGEDATSVLLEGFSGSVSAVFDSAA